MIQCNPRLRNKIFMKSYVEDPTIKNSQQSKITKFWREQGRGILIAYANYEPIIFKIIVLL